VFEDDEDREAFLRLLGEVVRRFHWLCHAYCLMGNHYHLLVETPEANLSRGMRHLNGVYTQGFNTRHKRIGHVFQGRYKAVLVEKQSHLLEVSRYVVLNPVRAGIVGRAQAWRWSSYRATAGFCKAPELLSTDWILHQFGQRRHEAQKAYRQFVREGVSGTNPWEGLAGGLILGGKEFVASVRGRLSTADDLREVPRRERLVGRAPLAELLEGVGSARTSRDKAIAAAYVLYGYTMKEIADCLGIHYATVSRSVRRQEGRMSDRKT
jgi:REP element-mobilizing transposase RayT